MLKGMSSILEVSRWSGIIKWNRYDIHSLERHVPYSMQFHVSGSLSTGRYVEIRGVCVWGGGGGGTTKDDKAFII